MLINLTKRLKLKKSFQFEKVIIDQTPPSLSSKIVRQQLKVNRRRFEKRKDIFNQFVEIFDNQFAEVFDNTLKKIYIDIAFEMNDEFIYHVNERRRLCIFAAYEQKVFRIIYDENQHSNRHRCYQRIADTLYVFKLSRKLRLYIEHCSLCQLNQIKRYRFYEELIFIFNSSQLFHIITINFVITLSKIYDALLTIIDKFFRRVIILRNKIIYNAAE